jgi:hypothetical protein
MLQLQGDQNLHATIRRKGWERFTAGRPAGTWILQCNASQLHQHLHGVFPQLHLGLVRLFPIHMDWMGLKKIVKKFELFGIQTHPIPLNPHGLRANRTSPYSKSLCTYCKCDELELYEL